MWTNANNKNMEEQKCITIKSIIPILWNPYCKKLLIFLQNLFQDLHYIEPFFWLSELLLIFTHG